MDARAMWDAKATSAAATSDAMAVQAATVWLAIAESAVFVFAVAMGAWLHGRSQHTQRAYMRDAKRFMMFADKPLRSVKLIDLQTFGDHLDQTLRAVSVNRTLSAVKSLFAFGFQLGYFRFDVGRALKLPSFRDELAERILGETEVLRMISLESNLRNRSILMTLYAGGFREASQ